MKKFLVGLIMVMVLGWFVAIASAQQFGPTAPTPGTIINGGVSPLPGPVPVPVPPQPMTIRGSVQTLHGAPLPSDIHDGGRGLWANSRAALAAIMPAVTRGTWLNLLEINEYGYLEYVAGTQCSYTLTPQPLGMPTSSNQPVIQGCADQISGAFMFYGDWEGKPVNPFRQHYLRVSTPTFIGRTIKLPVGVSAVDLKTVNMEASPIETATTARETIISNKFTFMVDMKKIVPETLDLNVYAVVWASVEPYFPYVVNLPTIKADKFTNQVQFDITLPDGILPGMGVSATVVIADATQFFKVYAQAYAWATK